MMMMRMRMVMMMMMIFPRTSFASFRYGIAMLIARMPRLQCATAKPGQCRC